MTTPAMPTGPFGGFRPSERLNVIALVSGGKDSFFSLLHCLSNGHHVVALANLYPETTPGIVSARSDAGGATGRASITSPATTISLSISSVTGSESGTTVRDQGLPHALEAGSDVRDELEEREGGRAHHEGETDLNSFMYQTVGHQVIPLYADATGIPLYRQPIVGSAIQQAREYADPASITNNTFSRENNAVAQSSRKTPGSSTDTTESSRRSLQASSLAADIGEKREIADETESMIPLLLAIKRDHPEANALSAGAILSTYQRTRVESVAIRLGLVPVAYLWKFPVLPVPCPSGTAGNPEPAGGDDAQLLRDLGAAGVEARIIKVASGGLDEGFLWENVGSSSGIERLRKAMRRFGSSEKGAVLGEGGEFETLVVNGPRRLFKGRINVADEDMHVVREGGANAWLSIRRATVAANPAPEYSSEDEHGDIRIPDLLDEAFRTMLAALSDTETRGTVIATADQEAALELGWKPTQSGRKLRAIKSPLFQWCMVADAQRRSSIEVETSSLVEKVRSQLSRKSLSPTNIINTVVMLRRMSDFPTINKIYGPLFPDPNPPARVTISCGDQLPSDVNIAVIFSAHTDLAKHARQGLHVQSRSYWAPANIGPYSQAITVPVSSLFPSKPDADISSDPWIVSIAGQIPLVPATMDLAPEPTAFSLQLVLSLQHLWRIGTEMGVQWWSSVVAYVSPATPASLPSREKALLAAQTWQAAHLSSTRDGDSDAGGPDLWDRKYDPRYMSFSEGQNNETHLPDWAVLDRPEGVDEEDWRPVPPVFLAEVKELPRSAQVEWHAYAGLSQNDSMSIRCSTALRIEAPGSGAASMAGTMHHTVLQSADGNLVLSVVTWNFPADGKISAASLTTPGKTLRDSLIQLAGWIVADDAREIVPDLTYADLGAFEAPEEAAALDVTMSPVIPCASLWGARGERLAAVVMYKIVLVDLDSERDVP